MPWALRRFQDCGHLHFITFSCFHRKPRLESPAARAVFEQCLERMRRKYGFVVHGYVVMPEHVHLLLSEPAHAPLATALQAIKQAVSKRLGGEDGEAFWQERYYDFNLFSESKRIEKLRYMHRNPVTRGLVESPSEWEWSSFRHYLTGAEGTVEIESIWTARKRELAGDTLKVKARTPKSKTPP